MRIERGNYALVALLAICIACIAKDLGGPLLIVSLLGLFDRLIGEPVLRARNA